MQEYLKVYDEQMNYIGDEPRTQVHKNGKWHYVFHCWVYNKVTREIVLQKRANTKQLFPRCYDVSCAGHYSHDEDYESTRELLEELGLKVDYSDLIYLTDFKDEFLFEEICDREIAKVYLFITDTLIIQPSTPEEIHSIITCDFDDFMKLIHHEIEHIETKTLYGSKIHSFRYDELVPRKTPYYELIFKLIKEQIRLSI